MSEETKTFDRMVDGEEAKMETMGILALAAGYIRWQAASGSQASAEEAGFVALALERHALRHAAVMMHLIYPEKKAR